MKKNFLHAICILLSIPVYCQPIGYDKLVYSDEFDNGILENWYPSNGETSGDPADGCEASMFYMKDNVVEEGGLCKIIAREEELTIKGKTKQFTSGIVHSSDYLYGYFEISAKLPKGNGMWPAFWFWTGCSLDAYREIDVMEACGCDCEDYTGGFFHEIDYNNKVDMDAKRHQSKVFNDIGNLCNSFHKYGLEWTPDSISYFFDGKLKFSKASPNLRVPMPIYLNLAVEGCYGGCGVEWCSVLDFEYNANCSIDCNTKLPQSFEIDYLKIWKKEGTAIEIKGDKALCLGKKSKLYAPYFPDAKYTWTAPASLNKKELNGVHWDCFPVAGVYNQIEIDPTETGTFSIGVETVFPSGYVETKSINVLVSNSLPDIPNTIEFSEETNECCYRALVAPANGATSYSWKFDEFSLTSESNKPDFCISPLQTKTVSVKGQNGCGESAFYGFEKYFPAIHDCDWSMKLSPNPVSDFLKIEIAEFNGPIIDPIVDFQVFDALGQLLLTGKIETEKTLDLSNFNSGVYILTVEKDGKQYKRQFIKINHP